MTDFVRQKSINKNIIHDNWYALCVRHRAEKKVYNRLTISGYRACLPLITKLQLWSDRKKKIQVPLISSFVFIRTSKENLNEALLLPGVSAVLKWLGKPAVIRDFEIENLIILCENHGVVEKHDSTIFEKGEEVEVINGPFAGLRGQTVKMKGHYRVVVTIESMGFAFSADIPRSYISKRKAG